MPTVNKTEIQATQYYVHRSYVNTYYAVYKRLEEWLADTIFRHDKTRVFLASDSYAFRRRFELTDTSKDYNTLEFSALNFPFANYWPQQSGWIVDPRLAGKSAALSYIGIYEGNTKLKAASSLITIPVTFYFDREDDARLAYDSLYFYSFNEHYYTTKVAYGRDNTVDSQKNSYSSTTLDIPVNIEITNLQFNPSYKETDWLQKQRIFPIKADFIVRSYTIMPPDQPSYDKSVNLDGTLSDGTTYEDGINFYYLVDDAILNFTNTDKKIITCDAGFKDTDQSFSGTVKFPEIGEPGVFYVDSHCEKDELGKNSPTNIYIWDSLNNKYIHPDYIDCASVRYNGTFEESTLDITKLDYISKITANSNTISWNYGPDTEENIESIEIHLANNDKVIQIDPTKKSYKLEKLTSNSQYYGYIIFYAKDGSLKKFIINFITPMSKQEEKQKQGSLDSLIGETW